jgi:predicted CXXCH cytochrome family protein
MKIYKLSLILVAAVAVVFGLSGISFAFHSGGVAECTGCHQMHNAKTANLTIGIDPSTTCLECHGESGQSSYHVATPSAEMPTGTPPNNQGPGGDFGWLNKTYYPVVRSNIVSNYGYTHGHNITALGYDSGYLKGTNDPKTTAPGGGFPTAQLGCTSCHDMHGKGRWTTAGTYSKTSGAIWTSGSYGALPTTINSENLSTGVYRLLRAQESVDGVTFGNVPVAVANSGYNRSEYYTQTRTAYGSGMSDFCGTCHPDMHTTASILRHPTGQVMAGSIQSNYNSYVKSGAMTGSATTSYLSLVPFEEGLTYTTANISTMKSHAQVNDSVLDGPGSGSVPATATIMCLSCHRAHASAFENMLKWDPSQTTIITAGAYPTGNSGLGYSATEVAKGYYNYNPTKFSQYQRQLCNKCHAKD